MPHIRSGILLQSVWASQQLLNSHQSCLRHLGRRFPPPDLPAHLPLQASHGLLAVWMGACCSSLYLPAMGCGIQCQLVGVTALRLASLWHPHCDAAESGDVP